MHRHAGRFADGVQARHDGIGVVADLAHDFAVVVGRDATHVVVHGRDDRDRLLVHVHASEDAGAFGDTRQLVVDDARAEVGQVEQDVILVLADAAAFADLDGHRTRHHVARGQILVVRCIALHEALAVAVAQDAAFATHAFGDQAARAVDTGRVELHELHVLHRQAGTHDQTAAVAGAGVGRGGAEVGAAVTAGGQHHAVGAEQVQRAVGHVQGEHAAADAFVIEDQVEREVLDHEARVVRQRLLVQRVQHGVAGTIGGGAGALRGRAFAVLGGHATERALVDLALFGTAERHAVVFQFDDGRNRFAAHVLDGVLVTQPIRALDGVEEVVTPVVFAHVAERGGNTALCGHGVRTGREDLGQADGLQALGGKTERSAQASATGADHDHVVLVFRNLVSGHLIWIPVLVPGLRQRRAQCGRPQTH